MEDKALNKRKYSGWTDYFQKEEQRRIKEELDALLRDSNPINNDQKLTAEELENFYSITARRKKKKRHNARRKALNIAVLGAGAVLIFGIMWITFNSIQAMFSDRENQLTKERKQEIEILNEQINELKQENEELSSKNLELITQVEELKTQIKIKEQFSNVLGETTESKEEIETSDENQISYYTVQTGDTLWKISTKLYGNGKYYKISWF